MSWMMFSDKSLQITKRTKYKKIGLTEFQIFKKKSCEPVTCAIIEASKWVCGMLLKNYQNFVDTSFDFLFGEKFWDKPRTGPSEANPIRHFIRSLTNLSNSSLMRIAAATYRNPWKPINWFLACPFSDLNTISVHVFDIVTLIPDICHFFYTGKIFGQ